MYSDFLKQEKILQDNTQVYDPFIEVEFFEISGKILLPLNWNQIAEKSLWMIFFRETEFNESNSNVFTEFSALYFLNYPKNVLQKGKKVISKDLTAFFRG